MSETIGVEQTKLIHAEPTKDFFVKMITRDIALEDCIFDLLDNSIDGARRLFKPNEQSPAFENRKIEIDFGGDYFSIKDNCGGIKLSDAIDYAFHFGRRPDSPADVAGGIGLYGIGMKRAIFKIGSDSLVFSEAEDACFTVRIDVNEWLTRDEWDFEYDDAERTGEFGTSIKVTNIDEGVASEFLDPQFKNNLIKKIARDYAFFIAQGLSIKVLSTKVPEYSYQLRNNDNVQPALDEYSDGDVNVRIVAGLIEDLADEIPDDLAPEKVERFGWFIVCNNRIVLAADKSENTIWGDDGYRVWHPQYNGFSGFVFFDSNKQSLLPWTTTKRQIDSSSPLYRRAVKRMKSITDDFVKYTHKRKTEIDAAKVAEQAPGKIDVTRISKAQRLVLPALSESECTVEMANIAFKRPITDIKTIRDHLGSHAMSYRDIGQMTFQYYMDMEIGK